MLLCSGVRRLPSRRLGAWGSLEHPLHALQARGRARQGDQQGQVVTHVCQGRQLEERGVRAHHSEVQRALELDVRAALEVPGG